VVPTRATGRGAAGRAGAIADGPYPRRYPLPLSDPVGRALRSD
jgi:hypothetical protein